MELIRAESAAANSEAAFSYCSALEQGNILFLAETPFDLPDEDRNFLRGISGVGAAHHKNVAYKPNVDKVSGAGEATQDSERLREIMSGYSRRVIEFVSRLLPRYAAKWKVDYASFRSEEEEGRDLPWKKRNDLLHVDAFPSRPTNGDMILRVFTNINPSKNRVWLTSDPFEPLAQRYARDAGIEDISAAVGSPLEQPRRVLVRALKPLGLVERSPYDRFMLGFHDYLKQNQDYQENCTKYRFEFPPDSTWLVFTDVVPHSVLSGQYALEQTLIISRDTLALPEKAPVSILEALTKTKLTNPN
jgi:hypothetical protein